ncbi:MAG TPA: right-handed parallel beta-helix repeat-containing protein, partial [Chloroflexota bacterium]|nr:right-handed parallel beta-helix repeat-containing protein [Chloroflexota bacterium]
VSSYLISNQTTKGGGILSFGGTVNMEMSALRSNIATGWGGGVYVSGGTTQLVNNTFSDNRADRGGGLYKAGEATLTNNTFNENRADLGGALYNAAGSSTVKNNIFANSLDEAGSGPSLNCDGPPLTSAGRNIVSDNSCVAEPSDLLSTDPLLGIWNAMGGPLRAYALLPGSPAIDYGLDCPSVDQRGWPRPLGAACDVGSIEYGGIIFLPLIIK